MQAVYIPTCVFSKEDQQTASGIGRRRRHGYVDSCHVPAADVEDAGLGELGPQATITWHLLRMRARWRRECGRSCSDSLDAFHMSSALHAVRRTSRWH